MIASMIPRVTGDFISEDGNCVRPFISVLAKEDKDVCIVITLHFNGVTFS